MYGIMCFTINSSDNFFTRINTIYHISQISVEYPPPIFFAALRQYFCFLLKKKRGLQIRSDGVYGEEARITNPRLREVKSGI